MGSIPITRSMFLAARLERPDGSRFVMIDVGPDANPTRINVVQSWAGEIARGRESAPTH